MATPYFEKLDGLESFYDQIQKKAIGGMAEVYLARQINLDRPVAIKRIRSEYRGNPDIEERFKREAKACANLLHQNIAHVYDYRKVGIESYLIMEWIDGFDLAEIISKGPLPQDVAAMIAYKVLVGLSHIHSHGLIHRDLKPDNIRISTRGEVKIMDLGIALDPSEQTLTMPGILIGSPHYLAPEQVIGAKVDQRADLFSFGITLYEMLTSKRPFVEGKEESLFERIQKAQYIDPQSIQPGLDSYLVHLVEQCLQKDISKRAPNANKLAASLQDYILKNYSLNYEARIKQFLMQINLMPGDPKLIVIEEVTGSFKPKIVGRNTESPVHLNDSTTGIAGLYTQKKNSTSWIFWLILILAGCSFAFFTWWLGQVPKAPPPT